MCSGETRRAAHIPVLFHAVLEGLQVRPGGRYIDATVGGGGHASGILAASSPGGQLLGLDRDPSALRVARLRLANYGDRATLVHSPFNGLKAIARARDHVLVDGVLFDLGLSSFQLAESSRGFSFSADGPLDMRFDPTDEGPTAAELVNDLAVDDLTALLYRFGEEREAPRIARAIVASRPIWSTRELADVVSGAASRRRRRIHAATLTFQALRIAVNEELDLLSEALPQAVELLVPGGRLAVISFHSLEDRLVKRFLRQESRDCICPPEMPICRCGHRATLRTITRRPCRPSPEEVGANSRARSARLRVAERVAE